jgi:hypothetical protein
MSGQKKRKRKKVYYKYRNKKVTGEEVYIAGSVTSILAADFCIFFFFN